MRILLEQQGETDVGRLSPTEFYKGFVERAVYLASLELMGVARV